MLFRSPEKPEELSDEQWSEYIFLEIIQKVGLQKDGCILRAVEDGLTFGETQLTINLDHPINLLPNNQENQNEHCAIYI